MDFSIRKKFWTAENQGFSAIANIHACRYVNTVDTGIQFLIHSMLWMSTLSIQTCTHISIHNFVNIQWIFNPEKVLDS